MSSLPRFRRPAYCLASLAVCFAAVGCGTREPFGTVRGRIAYKKKPVASGSVVFIPKNGPVASGKLAPDGSFTILNHEKSEEIPLGSYAVMVMAGMDQISYRAADGSRIEPTVPLKFTSQSTSPLAYEIAEGPNEISISLDEPPSVKVESAN